MTPLFQEQAKLVQFTAPLESTALWRLWGHLMITSDWLVFDVTPMKRMFSKPQPQRIVALPTSTFVSVEVESYQAEGPTGLVAATFRRANDYLLFSLQGFVPQVRLQLEPVTNLLASS